MRKPWDLLHVTYYRVTLPGRVVLQVERLCPDIVFSRGVKEVGLPLSEVLRKQIFLFSKKNERKKTILKVSGKYKSISHQKYNCKFYSPEKHSSK